VIRRIHLSSTAGVFVMLRETSIKCITRSNMFSFLRLPDKMLQSRLTMATSWLPHNKFAVDLLYLNEQLDHKDKHIEDCLRHNALIPLRERGGTGHVALSRYLGIPHSGVP
jgi:hypothetical protein